MSDSIVKWGLRDPGPQSVLCAGSRAGQCPRWAVSSPPQHRSLPTFTDRFALQYRRVLITGGSRGLGAEIAELFADAGGNLVLIGRDRSGLGQTRDTVQALGLNATASRPISPRRRGLTRSVARRLNIWER